MYTRNSVTHDSADRERYQALTMLQRKLRAITDERDIITELGGIVLGKGVQKRAFLVKGWVVKENTGAYFCQTKGKRKHLLPTEFQRAGLHEVKTYIAGQWVIQEPCTPMVKVNPPKHIVKAWDTANDAIEKYSPDTHQGNCGILRNKLVCFDW